MSKRTDRERRDGGGSLVRAPSTRVASVRQLAPEALHALIQTQGLEDSGALVSTATAEQLRAVLDLDVWRAAPGREVTLDADRMGDWFALLADLEPEAAERAIAAIGHDLASAGLAQYVRVFDPGVFEPTAQSDDEQVGWDREPDGLSSEVGGYVVHARRAEAWDAILTLLIALDTHCPACFHSLMRGCRRLSNDGREVDELDDLLTEPDQVLYDLAGDREDRQSARGYSASTTARAFLALARVRRRTPADDLSARLLVDASFRDAWPADSNASNEEHAERQLAFLANTLMAGCSVQGRPFTATEAATAVAGVCGLGGPRTDTDSYRQEQELDHRLAVRARDAALIAAFERGWALLHERVSMVAARGVIAVLAGVHGDSEGGRDLQALGREIARCADAGEPWRARDVLDPLATLDLPAWTALLGLFSECPVVADALMAIVEGRTGPVSATSFAFVSTVEQLDAIDRFMVKLPRALGA